MQVVSQGKILHNFSTWRCNPEWQIRALQHLQAPKKEAFVKHLIGSVSLRFRTPNISSKICYFKLSLKIAALIDHMKQVCTTLCKNKTISSDLWFTVYFLQIAIFRSCSVSCNFFNGYIILNSGLLTCPRVCCGKRNHLI